MINAVCRRHGTNLKWYTSEFRANYGKNLQLGQNEGADQTVTYPFGKDECILKRLLGNILKAKYFNPNFKQQYIWVCFGNYLAL